MAKTFRCLSREIEKLFATWRIADERFRSTSPVFLSRVLTIVTLLIA
jgi:hypothetical protein